MMRQLRQNQGQEPCTSSQNKPGIPTEDSTTFQEVFLLFPSRQQTAVQHSRQLPSSDNRFALQYFKSPPAARLFQKPKQSANRQVHTRSPPKLKRQHQITNAAITESLAAARTTLAPLTPPPSPSPSKNRTTTTSTTATNYDSPRARPPSASAAPPPGTARSAFAAPWRRSPSTA